MNENKTGKTSISKAAWGDYKKLFQQTILPSSLLFCVALLAIFLYILTSGALWAYFCFLIVPAIFALQVCVNFSKLNQSSGVGLFFQGLTGYFSNVYLGLYRMTLCVLKSFVVYFLSTIVVTGFYGGLSPEFNEAFNEVYTLYAAGNYEQAVTYLSNSQIILDYLCVSTVVSVGLTGLAMFRFLGINCLNFHLRSSVKAASSRAANMLFARGVSSRKGEILKQFYSIAWPGFILFSIGYLAGAMICYLYSHDPYMVSGVGLAGAMLLLTPYWSYFFLGISHMWRHNEGHFVAAVEKLLRESIAEMEKNAAYTDEQIKQAKEAADALEKANKEKKEEQDKAEKEEEESNKHDPSEYL
ncbi:MAG: hypothetical protein Q4F15_05345 [Bacillota bacterium]|nr:hypothetical protein [Bacillota bacterium]